MSGRVQSAATLLVGILGCSHVDLVAPTVALHFQHVAFGRDQLVEQDSRRS